MPNDLSQTPAPPAPPLPDRQGEATALRRKTEAWCNRAEELARDPALSAEGAARALSHLSRLGRDVAERQLALTRTLTRRMDEVRGWFAPAEARIKAAQAALTAASTPLVALAHHDDDLIEGDGPLPAQPLPAGVEIGLRVVGIDRDRLDLEALRPYFTDHALKTAVARHELATGDAALGGVVQRRQLAGALTMVTVTGDAWTPERDTPP
jgi:hypothetical protein